MRCRRHRYTRMAPGETDVIPYNGREREDTQKHAHNLIRSHRQRHPHKQFRTRRTDAGVLIERIA